MLILAFYNFNIYIVFEVSDMDKLTLGQKISLFRKNYSMTQKQFASLLHVSDKVVSKWELGYSEPDLDTLKRISQIFNISTDELLNNNSEKIEYKPTFNERAFKFFKNYYIILLQLLLSLFCLLDVAIGYSILSKDVPTLYFVLMLCFSISIFLLDIFVIITKNKGTFAISLLFFTLFLTIAYLVVNCVFYCNVENDVYEKFLLVSIIFSIIILINGALNILKYFDVLKCTYVIHFGKIVKIIVIVVLVLSSCFIIGNITSTSVMYNEEKLDQKAFQALMFFKYEYNFFTIGDQEQIKSIFFTSQEADKLIDFYSKDENVVTVSPSGLLTAKGYGNTQVIAKSRKYEIQVNVNVKATSKSDITMVFEEKDHMYSGETSTMTLKPLDVYSMLANGQNVKFILRDENGADTDAVEILNYTYENFNYTLTIKAKDYGKLTKYVNVIVYDNDLKTYTHAGILEVESPLSMNSLLWQKLYAGNNANLLLKTIPETFSADIDTNDIEFVLKDEEGFNCDDLEIKDFSIVDDKIDVNIYVNHLPSGQIKNLFLFAFDKKNNKYIARGDCQIYDISSIDLCIYDEFYVGESVDIISSYSPAAVIGEFEITSTNSKVAKVCTDGKIHIKGIGNAIVTITSSNGVRVQKKIVVNQPLSMSVRVDNVSHPWLGEKRVFTITFTNLRETYCEISLLSNYLKVVEIDHKNSYGNHYYYVTTECLDTSYFGGKFSISDENGEIAIYMY